MLETEQSILKILAQEMFKTSQEERSATAPVAVLLLQAQENHCLRLRALRASEKDLEVRTSR
jgi:hypothetical protein